MGKFQPRVIKQNRGSSGEGIWIINLKSGDYCTAFGDATVGDDDELIFMEANDNHVENHTVKEFIAWCISGRDKEEVGKRRVANSPTSVSAAESLKASCVLTWSTPSVS